MEEILIVDGYNVIHAWTELTSGGASLEEARVNLINILSDYRGSKGNRIIVVFDAHSVKGIRERVENIQGILVIYSAEGQTADSVIEGLVSTYTPQGRVYVVTSDWEEQRVIFGRGAYRLPARELVSEVKNTQKAQREIMEEQSGHRGFLSNRLNPELRAKLEKMRRGKG